MIAMRSGFTTTSYRTSTTRSYGYLLKIPRILLHGVAVASIGTVRLRFRERAPAVYRSFSRLGRSCFRSVRTTSYSRGHIPGPKATHLIPGRIAKSQLSDQKSFPSVELSPKWRFKLLIPTAGCCTSAYDSQRVTLQSVFISVRKDWLC